MHDTIKCELFCLADSLIRTHHLLSVPTCSFLLAQNYGCNEFAYGIIIGEFSTIFNDCRVIMRYLNLKQNKIYSKVELLFALSFLFLRLIVAPFYTIYLYSFHIVPLFIKLASSLLSIVSTLWCAEMIMTIGLKLSENSKEGPLLKFRKFCLQLRSSKLKQYGYSAIIFIPQYILSGYMHYYGN